MHGDGSYIKKPDFLPQEWEFYEGMFVSEQKFVVRYAQMFSTNFSYNYSELRDLRQTSV